MPRLEFDIDTDVAPGRVLAALTDFTERRPDLWPSLDRDQYAVYDLGPTSALVREGSNARLWAMERYDWSRPGVVRWEVVESSFCRPGSFVEAEVAASSGGSRIHVTWDRRPIGLMGRLALWMVAVSRGAPVKSSIRKGLARVAERDDL